MRAKKAFAALALAAMLLMGWWGRGTCPVDAWARMNALIGDTGSPQVVAGRGGWLFYREALDSAAGANRMSGEDVERLAQTLCSIRSELARQGAAFVLLVAPDKATACPDRLPFFVKPVDAAQTNRARLLSRLGALGVPAPDVLPALRGAALPAYLPRDTHWSAYGAWLAVGEALRAAGFAWDGAAPAFTRRAPAPGDLHRMILPGQPDAETDLLPREQPAYTLARPMRSPDDMRIRTRGRAGGPAFYVARDSFGRAAFPYLAAQAGDMTFVRGYAGFANGAQGADLAMIIVAERSLPALLERLTADE